MFVCLSNSTVESLHLSVSVPLGTSTAGHLTMAAAETGVIAESDPDSGKAMWREAGSRKPWSGLSCEQHGPR